MMAALTGTAAAAPRPHIVAVLQDDLAWGDVHFNFDTLRDKGQPIREDQHLRGEIQRYEERLRQTSPHLSSLVNNGVRFDRHYTHFQCSPSRRSFLTGRTPLHAGEQLSLEDTDDIDLRMTTIGTKLKNAGYMCYYFGKGHTGFMSMNHMPLQQGFDKFVGFIGGEQSYTSPVRWNGNEPTHDERTYSTKLYMEHAVSAIHEHPQGKQMFMYLPWQSVHGPYEPVSEDMLRMAGERRCVATTKVEEDICLYLNMLAASDVALQKVVDALHQKGMWDRTLMLYTSDNGGIHSGNNYPLRGEKQTNFEGGVRAAAFVTGGFVPAAVRGSSSKVVMSLADWYPTFCNLAGVDGSDNHQGVPGVDGVNVWPMISKAPGQHAADAAHKSLWVSSQVLIMGDFKLVVAQPKVSLLGPGAVADGFVPDTGWKSGNDKAWVTPATGWKRADAKAWIATSADSWVDELEMARISNVSVLVPDGAARTLDAHLSLSASRCSKPEDGHSTPCLFNVGEDPSEFFDLATQSHYRGKVNQMWSQLKNLNRGAFKANSPGSMLGACNKGCAKAAWDRKGYGGLGPQCAVQGCSSGDEAFALSNSSAAVAAKSSSRHGVLAPEMIQ
jgi:arylsulfatase A-like enzyme